MLKIEELIIPRTATVLETMKKLDETGQRILFIAPEGVLQAVVTDGDIRKFFLRGGTLEGKILVADPNSRERSLAAWEPQLILDELSPARYAGAPIWEISTRRETP